MFEFVSFGGFGFLLESSTLFGLLRVSDYERFEDAYDNAAYAHKSTRRKIFYEDLILLSDFVKIVIYALQKKNQKKTSYYRNFVSLRKELKEDPSLDFELKPFRVHGSMTDDQNPRSYLLAYPTYWFHSVTGRGDFEVSVTDYTEHVRKVMTILEETSAMLVVSYLAC